MSKRVIKIAVAAILGFTCLTAETACAPSSGHKQEQPDPRESYVYQCADGTVLHGRKAYDKFHAKHPNVICKRVR